MTKEQRELVGIFPLDFTVRIILPAESDESTVARLCGWLQAWFNGAVTYHATVTTAGEGEEVTGPVWVVESHADEAQLAAHGDELRALVESLGDARIVMQVGPLAPPKTPAIYSTEEAAAYLGVSVATIKHHVHNVGDLAGTKIGPALAFTREELDRYKNAPRRGAGRPKREG